MSELTENQNAFLSYFVRDGCNPTEAARRAGYNQPKQRAYELLRKPNILAAIRKEQIRLLDGHLGNIALRTLQEVMESKDAPASSRVAASRAVLEVGGYFEREEYTETSQKPLSEMSIEELEEIVQNGRQKLGCNHGNIQAVS